MLDTQNSFPFCLAPSTELVPEILAPFLSLDPGFQTLQTSQISSVWYLNRSLSILLNTPSPRWFAQSLLLGCSSEPHLSLAHSFTLHSLNRFVSFWQVNTIAKSPLYSIYRTVPSCGKFPHASCRPALLCPRSLATTNLYSVLRVVVFWDIT